MVLVFSGIKEFMMLVKLYDSYRQLHPHVKQGRAYICHYLGSYATGTTGTLGTGSWFCL